MQILLASAKTMRAQSAVNVSEQLSKPAFANEANSLVRELAQQSPEVLAKAFKCSLRIAQETLRHYQQFFDAKGSQPAIIAYNGQAYKYLKAEIFCHDDLLYAQQHLLITSFLYGLLRPLDSIHPYRLEGNMRLQACGGENVFYFWKPLLTDSLIKTVKADGGTLIHLSTEEYEHLFDWKRVQSEVNVVKPLFYVDNGLQFKIVAVLAKTCRGAMARHLILRKAQSPDDLLDFETAGFTYQPQLGDAQHPHFIKKI